VPGSPFVFTLLLLLLLRVAAMNNYCCFRHVVVFVFLLCSAPSLL
jgi:hypothetical protein